MSTSTTVSDAAGSATTPQAAPSVTVRPVDRSTWRQESALSSHPRVQRCIRVTLNPAKRQLSAQLNVDYYGNRPADFQVTQWTGTREYFDGRSARPATAPDAVREYHWFPYGWSSAADIDALLHLLAPVAAEMLDAFQPVPGRPGALDWTPRSAAMLHLLATLAEYPQHHVRDGEPRRDAVEAAARAALKTEAQFITWGELHRSDPSIARGEWALADDETLDRVAEEIAANLDLSRYTLPEGSGAYKVTGVRSGLYEYRREAAAGLKVVQAADWYAAHPGLGERVHPSWNADSAELGELQHDEARAAAGDGLALVGFLPHALRVRDQLRGRAREELRRRGAAAAQQSSPRLRTAIAGLLLEIDSWGDAADGDEDRDVRLGELAGMSPEAVALLRTRIGGVEQWDGWMPVVVVRNAAPRTEPARRGGWWFGRPVK